MTDEQQGRRATVAVLKIARMGHPVLKRRAEPVPDPCAPEVRHLVADMIETMEDAPGIGLAAPQVHRSLRIVVFRVPPARAGDPQAPEGAPDGPVPLTVLINPVIEPLTDETRLDIESCLSIPGLAGLVPRCTRLRYRGVTDDGEPIDRLAEGFHARVIQHECDHLDGILYPQRMTDVRLLGFAEEIRRYLPQPGGAEGEEARR
jgi:peptide deformylase